MLSNLPAKDTDTSADEAEEYTTLAYRYRLLKPLNWTDECDNELRKANNLWNKLVEIERAHREKVRAVAASDSAVAAAKQQWEQAGSRYKELRDRRSALRKAARAKVKTPELDEQITAAKRARDEAVKSLREASRRAYEASRAELKGLETERQAAVKTARQNSALHWGTYNAVVEAYEVGRQRALKSNAEMQFRGFDGSGRIVQQIIGGMSVEELETGAKSQVSLGPDPRNNSKQIRALNCAVYYRNRVAQHVTWPIIWHRPFPADTRIQQVTVHKTTRGGRTLWHATFSLRVPGTAAPRAAGNVVAANPGWRRTNEGIRVLTTATAPGGATDHVFVPDSVVRRLELCETETGDRDRTLNEMVAWLRAERPAVPEAIREYYEQLLRAPRIGPRALHRLLGRWRAAGDPPAQLVEWAWDDKIVWKGRENRRARTLASRREHYRLEARRLLQGARMVVINEHDMAQTAQLSDSNTLPEAARAMRVTAAPSEMRGALIEYAHKVGIEVVTLSVANDRCAQCGAPFREMEGGRIALVWHCTNGHAVDQDRNYVELMLADPAVAAPPATEPPGDRPASDRPAKKPAGRWARLKAAAAEKREEGRNT